MPRIRKNTQTVPQPSLEAFQGVSAPKKVLKAGAAAVSAWNRRVAEAEAVALQQQRERDAEERSSVQRGVADSVRQAAAHGAAVEATQGGAVLIARDGLVWLLRKAVLSPIHYDAGLRFRGDYELANGTGVLSSLGGEGSHSAFGPKSGPTDAMLHARGRVLDALKGLGSPLLSPYVKLVAGEGVMLSDPVFSKDPRRVADHHLPCVIAFDILARQYGMIR